MTTASNPDTIAAIATAPGAAGVAIVRISGPEALRVADALITGPVPPSAAEARHAFLAHVHGRKAAESIDEVLVLIFRAPHSYTREDVVEIQGHGGRAVAARLLRATLEAGARLADPGEFTRRAFLNGRLDLLQAEAVGDLIHAQSERAAAGAMRQLDGSLSVLYRDIYDLLICTNADLEASIDFSQEELPETIPANIRRRIDDARARLESLLATWHDGHLLREGALVVIAGEPNAGKSTLMNELLGRDRSIVTPIPGTTRDTIEEGLTIRGILVRLVDTAGLRAIDCPIEQEGIRRATGMVARADLTLLMLDGSVPLSAENKERLERSDPKATLAILNKRDLGCWVEPGMLPPGLTALPVSLLNPADVELVRVVIADVLALRADDTPQVTISERHKTSTEAALAAVKEAGSLMERTDVDGSLLAAQALRVALQELGAVTGREYATELLDRIFSRFCIGK